MDQNLENTKKHPKLEKIKNHLIENKNTYLVGMGCLAVGTVVGLLVSKQGGIQIQIVDSLKVQVCSPTENYITMIARGDPGNVVRCNETGITYPSQKLCAADNDISTSSLSRHLNGLFPDIDGKTFSKLGKATVEG